MPEEKGMRKQKENDVLKKSPSLSLPFLDKELIEICEKQKLDDKVKKKIRDGCVLLRDAYEGRASHGLYSLLKGPAYKRALFIIHTHPMWMNVVIWASIIHASLIIWEPPNRLSSWLDPTLDPLPVILLEVACMGVFVADIVFKMLYFGDEKVSGWQDYISKEWQRNYMTIIFLFQVDFVLYHAKICPFRFARPFRLTVLAARHRDVRRLISFFPTMCVKLVTVFFLPLLGVLAFFSILCVRIYGRLPQEHSLDLGEDSFSSVLPAIRTLFLLSTIDNFDPVVTEAYKQHPISFFFFLAFIVFASFFLMSVALGVMFDLYLEDHEKTVKAEAKKEEKSMAKAFQKLDVEGHGKIKWLHFREMLVYLRPNDRNMKHDIAIFKELTRDMIVKGEEPHINSTNFRDIKGFLPVSFVSMKNSLPKQASSLQKFTEFWEKIIISVDSILILSGLDSMKVNDVKIGTIFLSFYIWHLLILLIFDFSFAKKYWHVDWRRGDSIILLICVVCHVWVNFQCQGCRPSFKCLLEAVAVIRIVRPVLHHRDCRQYMLAVLGVGPVLLHFGLLVATFNYMFAVIAMEMFALDPVVTTGPEGTRLLLACDKELPNFNCFSTGSLSVFMVFIEAGFGKVMHARQAEKSLPPLNSWQTAGINLYFIMVYAVMGIGLCNLLTTIVVEFQKVLEEDAEMREVSKRELMSRVRAKVKKVIINVKIFNSFRKKFDELMETAPHTGEREVMIGRSLGNWRSRLSGSKEKKH